jgi:hypothetical protein
MWRTRIFPVVGFVLCIFALWAHAQSPDIRNTKHNLSSASSPTRTVKSTQTTEICVYCHTPHSANTLAAPPLWNRTTTTTTGSYTMYSSASIDSPIGTEPGALSKLCLSCHDGTLAVSSVTNSPGSGTTGTIATAGLDANGKITLDTGGGSDGYTRLISSDLSNDHPIVMSLNDTIAGVDGELRSDINTAKDKDNLRRLYGPRSPGVKPRLVMPGTDASPGKVQCITCHDPHLGTVTDTTLSSINNKFLRLSRFQLGTSSKSVSGYDNSTSMPFDPATDQICIACHTRLGAAWTNSAHADSTVANETYASGTDIREFPSNIKVWNAGCLNCHDTHTKTGARRLLREGADGSGRSAIENTCYQCHGSSSLLGTAAANTGLRTVTGTSAVQVPDIQTEFGRNIRMPIDKTTEKNDHDIRNANFEECRQLLGASGSPPGTDSGLGTVCNGLPAGTNANRHVECTDCHNPHRVRRGAKFYTTSSETDGDPGKRRTHIPGSLEGNVISGALRGAWGVQPAYPSMDATTVWPTPPSSASAGFNVKKGDPGTSISTAKTESYLTREYQLCFKCHSNYAYEGTPPALGGSNLTAQTANSFNTNNTAALYTNQAGEFAVKANEYTGALSSLNSTHQCEAGGDSTCTPIGASWDTSATNASTVNHRSWHPVMFPTGRTATERGGTNTNFKTPFTALGIQTMQCSDCHGHDSTWTAGTGPDLSKVQGPHGSTNNFLLRGAWNPDTNTPSSPGLCGNCHLANAPYTSSGWGVSGIDSSGHGSSEHNRRCGRCHIAVPHGWKNKAFLVNLNCVGKEGGEATDCVNISGSFVTRGPYYVSAFLRIATWRASRAWTEGSCGNGSNTGVDWMSGPCTN